MTVSDRLAHRRVRADEPRSIPHTAAAVEMIATEILDFFIVSPGSAGAHPRQDQDGATRRLYASADATSLAFPCLEAA